MLKEVSERGCVPMSKHHSQLNLLAIPVFLFCATTRGHEPIAIQRWLAASNAEIICRVTENPEKRWTDRQLSMTLLGTGHNILTFKDGDSFVAMIPTADLGGNLATVWEGGSAYHIRVWHYGGGHVSMVLEKGSRFLPELIDIDNDGTLEIVVTDTSTAIQNSPKTLRGTRTAYTWNARFDRYDAVEFRGSHAKTE